MGFRKFLARRLNDSQQGETESTNPDTAPPPSQSQPTIRLSESTSQALQRQKSDST